jgi:hypothetical protein
MPPHIGGAASPWPWPLPAGCGTSGFGDIGYTQYVFSFLAKEDGR